MNNCICCDCLDCGNEFVLPVPELLEEEPDAIIGEMFWCGACEGDSYECAWGLFQAGASTDRIGDVLRIWKEWAGNQGTRR